LSRITRATTITEKGKQIRTDLSLKKKLTPLVQGNQLDQAFQ
jgi:hypothetical protein